MKLFGLLLALVLATAPAESAPKGDLNLFRTILEKALSQHIDERDSGALVKSAAEALVKAYPSNTASTIVDQRFNRPPKGIESQLEAFGAVFEAVRNDHADAGGLLIEAAIGGLLTAFDPHSTYLSAEFLEQMQTQATGKFGGLGVEVAIENEAVKVVSAIDDTPAARAGLKPGDVITAVDGKAVKGETLPAVVGKMRGEIGTPVALTIEREDVAGPIEVELVRAEIRINSVRSRVEGDVGYIRISAFNETTFEGVKEAIGAIGKQLGRGKAKGYVIDLRNNPGGLLGEVVEVADAFLDKGEIVSVRGRRVADIQRFKAKPGDLVRKAPIVLLVNGGSASGAEILSGALQDNQRGTVVGTHTYGKGSVQTIVPLGDDGALRLTTARFFTASGRNIEGLGLYPDMVVEVPAEGGAQASGSDPQLEAALAFLRGEQVEEPQPQVATSSGKPATSAAVDTAPRPNPVDSALLGRRVALVIGNSDYVKTPALANPKNDAGDVAAILERLGFDVTIEHNLTKQGMDKAFGRFAREVVGADAALFYYAGHAMQHEGVNYIMPVDATLEDETVLPYEMVRLDGVLADMDRASGVRIVVLDACRNNPLEEQLKKPLARTRGANVTRGLAPISGSDGFLVAFATQSGNVAEDGDGRNSPFTASLLRQIDTPGLEVGLLFRRVTGEVRKATEGRQAPELLISLEGEFYFRPE